MICNVYTSNKSFQTKYLNVVSALVAQEHVDIDKKMKCFNDVSCTCKSKNVVTPIEFNS